MKQVIKTLPTIKGESFVILNAWVCWQIVKEWIDSNILFGLLFCAGIGIVLATLQ